MLPSPNRRGAESTGHRLLQLDQAGIKVDSAEDMISEDETQLLTHLRVATVMTI
jgi:hypothetical protein